MRNIIFLVLFIVTGVSSLLAQPFNPIGLRQTIYGQVLIEPAPLDDLTEFRNFKTLTDSTNFVKCIEYKISASGDTVNRTMTYLDDYLEYSNYSAEVYTFHKTMSVKNFPMTIDRKIKEIKNNELELTDYYWTGSTAKDAVDRPHILQLNYNKQGQLEHIKEIYMKTYNTVDDAATRNWDYKFKNNRIKTISAGTTSVLYNYDTYGNLISAVNYSGKNKFDPTYLSADSLKVYYEKKLSNATIMQRLNKENFEIRQLAFFIYSEGRLIQMLAYESESGLGVRNATFKYDSLRRISSIEEDGVNSNSGVKINYTYEQDHNRLLKRTERQTSGCFDRGCSESEISEIYSYNKTGLIDKIEKNSREEIKQEGKIKTKDLPERYGKLFSYHTVPK